MIAKYFPTKSDLESRLRTRFGGVAAQQITAAEALVRSAAAASWSTPQEVAKRRDEIKEALALLESGSPEEKVAYLRGAVDLQLTKASGLVTYCALVAAVASLLLQPGGASPIQLFAYVTSAMLCVIAAVATISTSMTKWPSLKDFSTSTNEADWLVRLLLSRGRRINVAVPLAIVATCLIPLGAFGPALWAFASQHLHG